MWPGYMGRAVQNAVHLQCHHRNSSCLHKFMNIAIPYMLPACLARHTAGCSRFGALHSYSTAGYRWHCPGSVQLQNVRRVLAPTLNYFLSVPSQRWLRNDQHMSLLQQYVRYRISANESKLSALKCSGSVVVKALCYKLEGRRFKTRWGGFFLCTALGPGIHSASNTNEYQKQTNSVCEE
jgi:hypothetical protein